MTFDTTGVPIRTLRLRSGLSQEEVAEILGFRTGVPVARHERLKVLPDLRTALGYEIIFGVPISSQFAAVYRLVEPIVGSRITALKTRLEQKPGRGPSAARNAKKLMFFCERESPEIAQHLE